MPSSVSNNSFSYFDQIQNLYSKPYKGNNFTDSILTGNVSSNTSNDVVAVDNKAAQTQDKTSLSPEALQILKDISSQNNNIVSQLLGGSGSDTGIAELFVSSLAADPFSKAILSQSSALIQEAGNNLLKKETSSLTAANDPIQKALKAYQAYQNTSNENVVDEVA